MGTSFCNFLVLGLLFQLVAKSSNLPVTQLDTLSSAPNGHQEIETSQKEIERKSIGKSKDSNPVFAINLHVFDEKPARDDTSSSTSTKEAFLKFANQLVESQLDGWQDLNPFVKHLLDTVVEPVKIGNSTMSLVDLLGTLVIEWIDFGYRH